MLYFSVDCNFDPSISMLYFYRTMAIMVLSLYYDSQSIYGDSQTLCSINSNQETSSFICFCELSHFQQQQENLTAN